MSQTPYAAHLLVVCHGLWGNRSHVAYICESAEKHATASSSQKATHIAANDPTRADDTESQSVRLVVLPTSFNENDKTYDGIDTLAERCVEEIDAEIKRIEEDGGAVTRFSITGYSLGGLVARFILGLLESRTPSFFNSVDPVNFTTFATPHIGIPKYKTFWSATLGYLGARMLSRTGQQLYESDRFLPLLSDGERTKDLAKQRLFPLTRKREAAEPLLAVLADPRYSFYKALIRFERVEVYANSVGDRTVPYPTGAIEVHDPFSLARARAQKAAHARGEDPDFKPDIQEGGLKIVLEDDAVLIKSYETIPPLVVAKNITTRRRFRFGLPLLLRPTTYPFSRPVSIAVIVFLPLAIPFALLFLVGRFTLQGRQSRKRIRELRAASGTGRAGMLHRVGVKLQETMDEAEDEVRHIVENAQPDNPEGLIASSQTDGPEERRPILRHPSFAAFASYGGTETPPLARPVSPGSEVLNTEDAADPNSVKAHPTDPVLSKSQQTMIVNLNRIPQLRKHLAYFPEARNAHGMIVCRDPAYPAHLEGRKVVDAWAKEFKL